MADSTCWRCGNGVTVAEDNEEGALCPSCRLELDPPVDTEAPTPRDGTRFDEKAARRDLDTAPGNVLADAMLLVLGALAWEKLWDRSPPGAILVLVAIVAGYFVARLRSRK